MRSRFILLLLACFLFAADQAGAQGSTGLALSVNPPTWGEAAGETTVTVTATLNGGARGEPTVVTVAVGATNDTATEGTDCATVSDLTLTIAADERSGTATFDLTPTNDDFGEGAETLSVSGTPTGTAAGLTVVNTQITITDDDLVSTGMTLSVSPPSVAENASPTPVTVTVTATLAFDPLQDDTDVVVSVGGGTAMAGMDYTVSASNFTVTIPAGMPSGSATFDLTPANNTDLAGEKTITISGTAKLPLTDRFTTRDVTTSTFMTITDDENKVTMSVDPAESTEGSGQVMLRILATLSEPRATVTTVNTTMFPPHISQINIPIGDLSRYSTTITINVKDNNYYTGDRTWRTTTVFAEPEKTRGLRIEEDDAVWVLKDDETESTGLTLSVSPTSVAEDADPTIVTVTAELNADAFGPSDPREVTVSVGGAGDSATEGVDYRAVPDPITVTIPGGSTSGSAEFTLTPTEDGVTEGDETLSVTGTAAGLTEGETELTIADAVTASTRVTLSVIPTSVREDAGPTTVEVTAMLDEDAFAPSDSREVTVSVGGAGDTATGVTDYASVTDFTVTIPGGSTSGSAEFTLTPTDDGATEGDETLSVTGTATGLTVTKAELRLVDSGTPSTRVTLSVDPTSVAENAEPTMVTVTARLNADAFPLGDSRDVTVSLGETGDTATEGTDYAAVEDFTVTIPGGATSGTATFTLTPTDDGVAEGDEALSVTGKDARLDMTRPELIVTPTVLTIDDDDTESTGVTLSVSPALVAENADATTVTVTATLNEDAFLPSDPRDVTVSVGAAGDAATEGIDYAAVPDLTVTIPGGSTSGSATFTLTPTDDRVVEGDETLSVTGTAERLTVRPTELTIADDDTESTEVTLSVSPTLVPENAGATTVTVTATLNEDAFGPSDPREVTVSLGAVGDTATEGTDYARVQDFTVTIPGGETSGNATFTLTPTDDGVAEGDETLSVTGTAERLIVTWAELTIADDDTESREVTLSVTPTLVPENAGATTVTVTATLDADVFMPGDPRDVTVSLGAAGDAATEGTDYAAVPDLTVTIPGGETSGSAAFTLTPTDDGVAEGDETLSVTGTAAGLTVTGTALTITDNETASRKVSLSVNPTPVPENAGATTVTVTATLDADAFAPSDPREVTVSLGAAGDAATEGTDYATVPDFTVTIPGGMTSGSATFTLTPTDDGVAEGDETLSVTGTAAGLTVTGTALTITDNETASRKVSLSVNPTPVPENAGATTVTVTATLDADAFPLSDPREVTVSLDETGDSATEGTDYARVPDFTVTIPGGETSGSATFTLTPSDDGVAEGDVTLSVTGTAAGLTVTGAELTIADDETESTGVSLSVNPTPVPENAGATTVTVTATLDADAFPLSDPREVTVSLDETGDTATEGTDYARVPDFTVTIPGGSTSGSAMFTLTPSDDGVAEGDVTLSVTGTAAGLTVTGTELTIADDDTESTGVALSVNPTTVPENAGATIVTVTATLDADAFVPSDSMQVTVSLGAAGDTATEGTGYAAVPDFTVTIPGGTTGGSGTFTLTPTDDGVAEGDETLSVTGTAAGLAVTGAELTIADDDTESTGVALSVNPTAVPENAGATTVTVTATLNADTFVPSDSRQVMVSVGAAGDAATEGTDYARVPDFTVTIPGGTTSGSATFTLTATDDGVAEEDETLSVTGAAAGLTVTGTELTIADDDAARSVGLEGMLAAIGSLKLTSAMDAIGARLSADGLSAPDVGLVGRPLQFDRQWKVDPGTKMHDHGMGACQAHVPQCADPLAGATAAAPSEEGLSWDEFLIGRPYAWSLASPSGAPDRLRWSVWGRGDVQSFDAGSPVGGAYASELRTAYLGVDARAGQWLAGVALAHGSSGGDYRLNGGVADPDTGRLETTLTAVHPYARWTPSARTHGWAILGIGRGGAVHVPDSARGHREESGLSMQMGALALRHALALALRGFDVALRADGGAVRLETGDGDYAVDRLSADSWRVRLGLDVSHRWRIGDGGGALVPFAEVSLRADGGDGAEGSGLETAAGVRYRRSRTVIELRARALTLRESGFGWEHRERGSSLTVVRLPREDGRGLSLSLTSGRGAATQSTSVLWQHAMPRGLGPAQAQTGYLVHLGYGLFVPGTDGLLTPFVESGQEGGKHVKIGARFQQPRSGARAFDLGAGISAAYHERPGAADPVTGSADEPGSVNRPPADWRFAVDLQMSF